MHAVAPFASPLPTTPRIRATLRTCAILIVATLVAATRPSPAAPASPLMHPLFTDHMVLQRDVRVPIWGRTQPGRTVRVELLGQRARCVAGSDGRWQVRMGPFSAHGATVLRVSDGARQQVCGDVLVGDVWICSGQSNMTMGVEMVSHGADEIAHAHHPMLRLFTVAQRRANTPQDTLVGRWEVCTPENLRHGKWGGFSATAYFFGRDLVKARKVPIGLVHTSWGGTPAEAWTSSDAFRKLPGFTVAKAQLRALRASPEKTWAAYRDAVHSWWQRNDRGTSERLRWHSSTIGVDAWKTMNLPTIWEQADLPNLDGVVWFRKDVDIGAEWAGHDLMLHLGPIDDGDTTWFNGELVGARDGWTEKRDYRIPGRLVKAGRNVISVRVLDTGGAGGIYGRPEEMRLELDAAHSQSLAGEWRYSVGGRLRKTDPFPPHPDDPNTASVLFNAMISPLVPLAARGVIWYQGESNSARANEYRPLLSAMIDDWRSRFGPLAFLIVGLAGYEADPQESWAALREAQAQVAQSVSRTALVQAVDIGEAHDIHPHNKQEVGRRLSLAARVLLYGERMESSGPTYRAMSVHGKQICLHFDHAQRLEGRGYPLAGFTIAGADRRFYPARAVIDGTVVRVFSPEVARPVAVRYAWASNPACSLYNQANLPAVPFRTDHWPL